MFQVLPPVESLGLLRNVESPGGGFSMFDKGCCPPSTTKYQSKGVFGLSEVLRMSNMQFTWKVPP